MKRFCYVEPGFQNEAVQYIYTEDDIVAEYWKHWCDLMINKYGEGHELITRENCIEDWVTVHWAWEIEL